MAQILVGQDNVAKKAPTGITIQIVEYGDFPIVQLGRHQDRQNGAGAILGRPGDTAVLTIANI